MPPARFSTLVTLDRHILDRPAAIERFATDIRKLMLQCSLATALDMTDRGFALRFP